LCLWLLHQDWTIYFPQLPHPLEEDEDEDETGTEEIPEDIPVDIPEDIIGAGLVYCALDPQFLEKEPMALGYETLLLPHDGIRLPIIVP